MSETDKESVRQCFAKVRENLPEGITEADADALQDIALRLMDRGLPRPNVDRHSRDGYNEISADFRASFGGLVLVADGGHQGYAFAVAGGAPIGGRIEFVTWPEAKSDAFIDALFETWAKVVENAGAYVPKGITSRTIELTDEPAMTSRVPGQRREPAMTIDLDAIERRAAFEARGGYDASDAIRLREQDVPALIAEARRLREKLGRALALLHMLDNIEARHPDVAEFLDNEGSQP